MERAKRAAAADEVARLIADYRLPREAVPTQWLQDPMIWRALVAEMPLAALVRNLATLTRLGVLGPLEPLTQQVCARIADGEGLRKARLHPIAVLAALKTYAQGRGERGQHHWTPLPEVVEALDVAFYRSFGNVESTGKRWLLALDVSGSMGMGTVSGVPGLTPRVASGALALVLAATEPRHHIVAFEQQLTPLAISPRQRLDDVLRQISDLPFGGTDCSLPMLYALEQRIAVDVFVIITDNETWAGEIHPAQALQRYRRKMHIPAKLVVVGMTATDISIADPDDAGMLDVVGFDAAAPALIADFARQ
jgi:60 kDa SS-A/Ro ribonucleoprotein